MIIELMYNYITFGELLNKWNKFYHLVNNNDLYYICFMLKKINYSKGVKNIEITKTDKKDKH